MPTNPDNRIFLIAALHTVRVRDAILALRSQAHEPVGSSAISQVQELTPTQLSETIDRYPDSRLKTAAKILAQNMHDFDQLSDVLVRLPTLARGALFNAEVMDQILLCLREMGESTEGNSIERLRRMDSVELRTELENVGMRWIQFNVKKMANERR